MPADKDPRMTVSFLIDIESEKVGYHFNNAPNNISERSMTKIVTVGIKNYDETMLSKSTKKCTGEMDADEFFRAIGSTVIKSDAFERLFLDHGKNFLPKFEKWESITNK